MMTATAGSHHTLVVGSQSQDRTPPEKGPWYEPAGPSSVGSLGQGTRLVDVHVAEGKTRMVSIPVIGLIGAPFQEPPQCTSISGLVVSIGWYLGCLKG